MLHAMCKGQVSYCVLKARCILQEAIRNLIAEGFPVQQVLLELQTAVLAEVGLHISFGNASTWSVIV